MMATLRSCIALFCTRQWEARSHRKTGTHFSGSRLKTLETGVLFQKFANHCGSTYANLANKRALAGRFAAQKGSPAKRTGHTSLVAAQYSQKSPKNNALFAIWLADLASNQPCASCHQVLSAGYTPRSTSSKWFMTASL